MTFMHMSWRPEVSYPHTGSEQGHEPVTDVPWCHFCYIISVQQTTAGRLPSPHLPPPPRFALRFSTDSWLWEADLMGWNTTRGVFALWFPVGFGPREAPTNRKREGVGGKNVGVFVPRLWHGLLPGGPLPWAWLAPKFQ